MKKNCHVFDTFRIRNNPTLGEHESYVVQNFTMIIIFLVSFFLHIICYTTIMKGKTVIPTYNEIQFKVFLNWVQSKKFLQQQKTNTYANLPKKC